MFRRLRERMFPPSPGPAFTDPTLGTLTWDPHHEMWWTDLGPASSRPRFAFARLKPSVVPPEPALALAREMSARLDTILRDARDLLAEQAKKATTPERAAAIREATFESFHFQMDRGEVCAHLLLGASKPNAGLYIVLHKGVPTWLAQSES